MASIFDGIDLSNPCEVWPVLNQALYQLLAGEKESRVRFGNDEVQYHVFTSAHVAVLERKVNELKAECEARQTGRRRRRAFTAGFR